LKSLDFRGWKWASTSAWANQTVSVSFRTEPGATPDYDYVFLEEPTLYTPSEHPKRLVLVFVDTLWPDFGKEHLERAIAEFRRRERRYGGVSG